MNFRIKVTKNFEKEAKPLLKKYPSFKKDIANNIDLLVKILKEEGLENETP